MLSFGNQEIPELLFMAESLSTLRKYVPFPAGLVAQTLCATNSNI